MYATDTTARVIYVYDFDHATGNATNRRIFAQVPADEGRPDGTTVDSEGYIWSARNGGARIVRYAPDGRVGLRTTVPTNLVTNMAFGGDDLRTLFITTASRNLPEEFLAKQPFAGGIFTVRVDVPGVRNRCSGASRFDVDDAGECGPHARAIEL